MDEGRKKRSIVGVLMAFINGLHLIAGAVFLLFFVGGCLAFISLLGGDSISKYKGSPDEDSILVMKLEGIIFDKSEFLEDLNKYIKEKKVKGVLIRIDSPGGGTAASQEIYKEILRLKALHKKPVVMSIGSIGASGAFYISMAGDKIIANEASLLGSIGVIIYLSNLEKLYEWAKIENYVVKTGEFKDSGTQFRPITNRERDLFQDLIDQFLSHFKNVIVENRKLSEEVVDQFADGRVFSGETALLQGFIDQTGTYYEALNFIGEITGLGANPEVFEPQKSIDDWQDFFDVSLKNYIPFLKKLESSAGFFHSKLQGRPLYLMPEFIGL